MFWLQFFFFFVFSIQKKYKVLFKDLTLLACMILSTVYIKYDNSCPVTYKPWNLLFCVFSWAVKIKCLKQFNNLYSLLKMV